MKNTMRMGFFVVSAVAALSGCDCGKTPPTACDTYTVNFRTPEEGATVSSPFTVKIDTSAPTAITEATLKVGSQTLSGTITGDGATFSGVTLPAGQQTLKAAVTTAECPSNATVKIPAATRSVNVAGSCTAKVTAVSFPQDASKNGVLNSKEFTGTDMQVRVDATCAMSDVKVHILRGTAVVSDEVSFSSGVATAIVKIATDATGDTRYDFFAELVQGTTPINSKVTNPEGLASIEVRRNTPSCLNLTASRQGPTTDSTPTAATFGLAASATIGIGGFAHAHFRIENGATSAEEQIGTTQDTVLASFSLPKTTATYNVIFEGTDGNDNTCTSSKMVTVDFTPPDIVITMPSSPDGGVVPLLGNSSAVVATVTKMGQPLSCVTTDGGYGGCAVLSRRQGADGGESDIDRADVVAGTTNLTANFPASTQYSLFVGVTDDVGNKAKAQVDVDVTLTGCGVEFVTPNACPKTIFPADLVNGNYGVTFKSSNCTSRPARLLVNGQLRNSGSLSGTGVFGPNAISFTSAATVTLRAEVDNASGPATALECVVTADLSTPVITNPAGPGPVTINASLDGSSTLPGAQRVLAFSATIPVGGRADLCTTQQKDPIDGSTRLPCSDNASGWYLLKSNIVTPGPSSSYSVTTDFPEGLAYSIKVVIVSGTSTNVSGPVALIVDVTRPCVAAGSMQFDRDDGAGKSMYAADGYLNKAEFAQTVPFLSFAPGCGDTAATLAANPVLVQQVISEPNVVALSGITQVVTTAGTRYNVDLTGFSGNSQVNFWVRLTDAVGNTSAYAGVTDPGRKTLALQLLDPDCNISSPQQGAPLGKKEVQGGVLPVTVSTDATSVKSNGVALSLTGATTMTTTATPVAGVATANFNGLTGDSNWTLGATCTDVAGNAPPQVTRVLHIDLIDPTIAFISPVDGGTYSVTPKIETKLAVGGADGMQVTVDSTLRAKILVQNVDAGFVDDTETVYDKGAQILTATVADPSGNVATQSISIVVNTDTCSLNATNVYNGHYIGPSNLDGGVADFTALSDCNSLPVSLTQLDSSNMPIGTLYTGASGASGDVKFSAIPVADGQHYRMTIDNGAGKLTTLDYFVDILPPAFTGYQLSSGSGCATSTNPCTTTTAAPATNLYFVAASTNRNVYSNPSGAAAAGYLPDSAPGGSPAAHFYSTIKGASGIAGGTVRIKYRNQIFGSVSVPTNQSAAVDIPLGTPFGAPTPQAVVIPHVLPIAGGSFTIEMVDPGGNVTTVYSASNAVVDVVAPADPNAQFTTVSRNGDMPITWTSVFGDTGGDSTSGTVQYEVVWTTSSVTSNNSLQQESNYMSAGTETAVAYREADSTQATGIGIHLPPINTYFVSVRARDAVGNLSPFVAPNIAGIANLWTPVTLSGTSLNYGAAVTMGNVVGDGTQDIIVGANRAATVGNVHVYTGGSGLAAQTDCTTGCQIIAPPDGVGNRFGSAVSATGDVDGDGVNDLLVSEPQFSGGGWTLPGTATVVPLGRVFLFFGKNGAGAAGQIDTTKYVVFTGDSAAPISNPLFGTSIRIVKDMNGDGRDEVLIGSPYWDTSTADTSRWSVGRVFIYAGQAAWNGTVTTVNSSSATWTLVGPDPKNGSLVAGTPPLGNGYALAIGGLASLGDVDGDGKSDLGVPMSYESSNLYQVWSSATLAAASAPLASTFATRTLAGIQIPATGNATGLGTAAVGNVHLVDGGVPDLVLSYPSFNSNGGEVRVYSGATSTQALTFDGANYFGNACAVGDLDGANGSDLIAAEGNSAPLSVWVAYQKPGKGFEFNCAGGTKTCIGSNFYSSKVQLSGTSRLGSVVLVGDVTGDGQADLVMSDSTGKLIRILK